MHIKTFGLEQEFFAVDKDGNPVLLDYKVPHDHCGYLAEARGEHHADPVKARFLLAAASHQLHSHAKAAGVTLLLADTMAIDAEFRRLARRTNGKEPAKSYFANGKCYKNDTPRAGLHVHFGTQRTITLTTPDRAENNQIVKGKTLTETVVDMCNMPRIIWMLDQAFKDEIRKARRVSGEYEMKEHGFEYRSLPATTDLDKLVDVLIKIQKEV